MARKKKWFAKPSDIKVGVIGYGGAFNMGKQHLDGMKRAGMTPFAVCDVDEARLEIAKQDFKGIETYTSLDAMLKQSDVNLIVHITPHNLHYPLAAKCLKAGKHVVTEKPFVVTTAECDKLIKIAKDKNLVVSTYHNRHWDGWIMRAVDQIVNKGVIGEVRRVEAHMGGYGMPREWWRTSKTISGGVLYDWGVHLLEYALQVVPSEITEVSGFSTTGYWSKKMSAKHPWKKDCNEDDASAVVRFANGCQLNLSISHLRSESRPYTIAFYGTEGAYELDFKEWRTKKQNAKGKWVEKSGKHPKAKGHLFYQ
ncbi:MAG: Gfo/Idh/MocA family oxidoreductase, partial [Planctomycetota bacterium]|nr:Gfo/Idh/MocA family oxidoreductase [Planctomycetota bacterium]